MPVAYFRYWRLALGAYFFIYTVAIARFYPQLYGPEALYALRLPASWPFAQYIAVELFLLRGLAALLLAFGWRWRFFALLLYGTNISLLAINPAPFGTPELPYLNFLLLVSAGVPEGDLMPRRLLLAQLLAWLNFGVSFLFIGFAKWNDSQGLWKNGDALALLLTNHYLRSPWAADVQAMCPLWFWKLGTWSFVASQLLWLPALFSRRSRQIWWGTSFLIHFTGLFLLDLPQVSWGVCLALCFLFPLVNLRGSPLQLLRTELAIFRK